MKLYTAGRIAFGAAVFGLISAVASQAVEENQRELDIVIRDFDVTHPDFENFQEEAYNSIHNGGKCIGGNCVGMYPTSWVSPGYLGSEWETRRADYGTYGCGNTQTPEYGIAVGVMGYPHDVQTSLGAFSTTPDYVRSVVDQTGYAWYGEFKNCTYDAKLNPLSLGTMRGLVSDLCSDASASWSTTMADKDKSCSKICKEHSWSQIVYTTPGMVAGTLIFKPELGEDMMYEPTIVSNRMACDNRYFDQWYTDVMGINKRSNTTLVLDQDVADPTYFEIDRNWNNGGYFPLDSVDANGNWVDSKYYPAEVDPTRPDQFGQFGPQSLSIFCPPYSYQWASSQTDFRGDNTSALCNSWLANGGPKTGAAARAAADGNGAIGKRHLRNYGFTMMGYAAFKYKKGAGEIFKFTGDDDMWIYVDGVLVVDLGGTHLAATGTADMDYLSSHGHGCQPGNPLIDSCASKIDVDGTWLNGSWHHLHFFYADRQSDGSNLRIRSSLSELAPSRYGQPAVGRAVVTMDENGNQSVSMVLNTALDDNTIAAIMAQPGAVPALLIVRDEEDPVTHEKKQVVYGLYVNSIEKTVGADGEASGGVQYKLTGTLRDVNGTEIASGIVANDKMAFNFPYSDELFGEGKIDDNYSAELWAQFAAWSRLMNVTVTSTSNKGVIGPPSTLEDWAVTKFVGNSEIASFVLDSIIARPSFEAQSKVLTEIAKNNDGELPLNATADLIFASVPAGVGKNGNPLNLTNEEKAMYSSAGVGGAVNPGSTAFVGGQTSATSMCFSAGAESCTSISYPVSGPFRINVRVFDHMGHFVSQYQQNVTEEMIHEALGPATNPSSCEMPLYGETGAAWITVKMYPVSQNGRLLATGPYIYQVTFIQEAYKHCLVVGATPQENTVFYSRTFDTYRFGYRRTKLQ